MKNLIFSIVLFLVSYHIDAQKFLTEQKNTQPLTFKMLQQKFSNWSINKNLKEEKCWKFYKRWEMDMLLHTNPKGELDNQADYINSTIQNAEEKNLFSSKKNNIWYPVGPNIVPTNQTGYMENGIGRINCITFHPTDTSIYYVGVAQGGLWKTNNCGQSWIPLTDNLPITRISDIAIDPTNPNTIYISVCDFEYIGFGLYLNGKKRNSHYGLGVYKSIDGGLNWLPTALSFQLTDGDASLIRKVIINQQNTNKLLACGVSGMYSSANGGATWIKTMDSLFWDMIQDPIDPNTLYAATGWVSTANAGYAAIYKTTNFGTTWDILNTSIPSQDTVQRIKLAIANTDNSYVYAAAVDINGGLYAIYKSTDAGLQWEFITPGANILEWDQGYNTGGQGNYDLGFLVDPNDKNKLYVGGINMWSSPDGSTFDPVSHWTLNYGPTIHADIHFIEYQKNTNNIFACTDGGIYRTTSVISENWNDALNGTPWPTNWINISNGMAISSFYRISSSQNTTGRLIAGAQDNGSFYYDGIYWSTVFGGDGMDNYLDPYDDMSLIGSSQYGFFMMSYDNGQSGFSISPNVGGGSGEWTTPLIADYNQYGTIYAGFTNVNKSIDGGYSWATISDFPPDPNSQMYTEISAMAVANSNSNYLYVAKRIHYEYNTPASFYRTTNGGSTWDNITAGLPDSLYYTSVEVNNTDANTVYVTMAGFSSGNKVFRSTNAGNTWQNITYNLPNIPVNCIKCIPNSNNEMMIATDIGVYVLMNQSTVWVNKSLGLPNVITSDIEFNPSLNKIYISTFGRGIWATDLDVFVSVQNYNLAEKKFKLYPTLNNGNFSISQSNKQSSNTYYLLDIIDIHGKVIYSKKISNQNIQEFKYDLSSGMYYAKISGNKTCEVLKFIVE